MKKISLLIFLLMGCLPEEIETEESVQEDFESDYLNKEFENQYIDWEQSKEENTKCPSYIEEFQLNGNYLKLEIPSECHLIYFEKGRPPEDKILNQDLILETPYSQGY